MPQLGTAHIRSHLPTLMCAAVLTCVSDAPAQRIIGNFIKVADTNTLMPGHNGPFEALYNPSLSNGNVVFRGFRNNPQEGGVYLYTSDGHLRTVVDNNTMLPGALSPPSSNNIGSLPALHETSVAFLASTDSNSGVYYYAPARGLELVADWSTPIPGTSVHFDTFYHTVIHNDTVIFDGRGGPHWGIYIWRAGDVRTIVDNNTLIPGTHRAFEALSWPFFDIESESIVFTGSAGSTLYGVYTSDLNGNVTRIADNSTRIPGSDDLFVEFNSFASIEDGVVTFSGGAHGYEGVYSHDGQLWRVVDRDTPKLCAAGTFGTFASPGSDGDLVIFGWGSVYASRNGIITHVIDSQDTIDGRTVAAADTHYTGTVSENQVVTRITFFDGEISQGIYILPVTGSGCSQADPVMPLPCPAGVPMGTFCFVQAPSGTYLDPPATWGYRYRMQSPHLFTAILDFPTGFSSPFEVRVNGTSIGSFSPGEPADFSTQPGGGVTSFTVTGIDPLTDAGNPLAFPLKLQFNAEFADLEMLAILQMDFDADADVDLDDFGAFQACMTGPSAGQIAPGCELADLDGDGDVDQADFGILQRCVSGPDVAPDPNCTP